MGRGGWGGRGGRGGWRGGGGGGSYAANDDPKLAAAAVLVMCDQGREARAMAATGDVLLEYARRLYPHLWEAEVPAAAAAAAGAAVAAAAPAASDAAAEAVEASIADEIAAELAVMGGGGGAGGGAAAAAAAVGHKRPREDEGGGEGGGAAPRRGAPPPAVGPVKVSFREIGRAMGLVWLTIRRPAPPKGEASAAAEDAAAAAGGGDDEHAAAAPRAEGGAGASSSSGSGSSSGSDGSSAASAATSDAGVAAEPAASSSAAAAAATDAAQPAAGSNSSGGGGARAARPLVLRIDAVALVAAIMDDLAAGRLPLVRNVSRLVPLQLVTSGFDDAVLKALPQLAAAAFPRPAPPRTVRWMAEVRVRNNDGVHKGEIQSSVGLCLPGSHRVDLTDPEVLVLVEAFNAFAGVAVVDATTYTRHKRFNMRLVCETDDERAARGRLQQEADAKAAARKAAAAAAAGPPAAAAAAASAAAGDEQQPSESSSSAAGGSGVVGDGDGDGMVTAVAAGQPATAGVGGGGGGSDDDSNDDDDDDEQDGGGPVLLYARDKKQRRGVPAGDQGVHGAASDAAAAGHSGGSAGSRATAAHGLVISHNAAAAQFEARAGASSGPVLAYLQYTLAPTERVVDFCHTFTAPEARGAGLAAQVTDAAMAWAKAGGLRVVPSCTYVHGPYLQRADARTLPELAPGPWAKASGDAAAK